MIPLAAGMLAGSIPWRAIGVAVLLGATFAAGWAVNGWRLERGIKAAELERQRAAAEQFRQAEQAGAAAGTAFEATRRTIEDRHAVNAPALRRALSAPLSCPPAASAPRLADLPLPDDVVGRLRDAGADARPDTGAAGSADR